jgi:hypothetical protein
MKVYTNALEPVATPSINDAALTPARPNTKFWRFCRAMA